MTQKNTAKHAFRHLSTYFYMTESQHHQRVLLNALKDVVAGKKGAMERAKEVVSAFDDLPED
jgi:hypothetical protein